MKKIILISIIIYSSLFGQNINNLIQTIDKNELYKKQLWLDINFYIDLYLPPKEFKNEMSKNISSIIQDENGFFLASDGKDNPRSEMIETIKFFQDSKVYEYDKCKYYNRYLFLKNNNIIDTNLQCNDIESFIKKHKNSKISYVQTSEGSEPDEKFGHSLVLLDNGLYEDFINFGATTTSYGGMIGLIDANFEILHGRSGLNPSYIVDKRKLFFTKIKTNDIFTKELFLSTAYIVSRYMKYIKFDYYFATQNCSSQALNLLSIFFNNLGTILNNKNWMNINPKDAGDILDDTNIDKGQL